ncbi:MAG TPA: ParB/RepB/Spo0J family partition protein [Terriglobia bacterium]|nr:ParB/RepB/Spo0J family partition protein [Terriglobia bacterium]
MAQQRKALGRGLSALLGTPDPERDRLREIDVDRIVPNANQPRKIFDETALDELADSIKTHGLVQPIVVQPVANDLYQIVAGERRWRAAQRAGITRLPAVIRDAAPDTAFEIALIENLQREDLNPIEEAEAYDHLISEYGLTQEDVAQRVGKSRATIANMIRLLRLPPPVRQWLLENKLSAGHAKALLALTDPNAMIEAAKTIIDGHYSVRQAEFLVAHAAGAPQTRSKPEERDEPVMDPNVQAALHALETTLGTRVVVHEHSGKGKFEIHFFSLEEMNRLYEGLMRAKF